VREALKQPLSEVERSKTGTTVVHLNKRDLEEVRIPVPDSSVLERFESAAEPLYQQRIACAGEARALQALRDALLPRFLSGELRVGEAGEPVEEAV
jgi:type I restriction enzyme S subunit